MLQDQLQVTVHWVLWVNFFFSMGLANDYVLLSKDAQLLVNKVYS